MKKFFGVMILLIILAIYGCMTNSFIVLSDHSNKIVISADNSDGNTGNDKITIPDGTALHIDAEIKKGKLVINIAGTEHVIDKSGEIFIDVPPGNCEFSFTAKDNLTGKITFLALPKV